MMTQYAQDLRGPVGNLNAYVDTLEDVQNEGGKLSAKVNTLINNWQTFIEHTCTDQR